MQAPGKRSTACIKGLRCSEVERVRRGGGCGTLVPGRTAAPTCAAHGRTEAAPRECMHACMHALVLNCTVGRVVAKAAGLTGSHVAQAAR